MGNGINAVINPGGSLDVLSQREINELCGVHGEGSYEIFRRCCLAVLNTGSDIDDTRSVLAAYPDFDVKLTENERGIQIELLNAPPAAFVDGRIILGIREHLSAVLRDIVYVNNEIKRGKRFDLTSATGITDAVFGILRHAGVLRSGRQSPLAVCWGGHSITREEYLYTKNVGYELGLRGFDVCTGCGPGAMKGPMKGATIGHAKQRNADGRYIGISEPGIVAAESPNPIVNSLVIMPDMEKRLEAFVRIGHGFVVFPGGVGTAEEMLYLLGILVHPRNQEIPCPLILTGPAESREYFHEFASFVEATLGRDVSARLQVVIDDPKSVARLMREQVSAVMSHRERKDEAYYFNWPLHLDIESQTPFKATHENMAGLELHGNQPVHQLACNLYRAFGGIVAGNLYEEGMRSVEEHGPFEIRGERNIMEALDRLLRAFVTQQRMRLGGREYKPCYRLVA